MKTSLPRLFPSDLATIAILGATLAVIAAGLAAGQDLARTFLQHLALLVGFCAAAFFLNARGEAVWARAGRAVATMTVIFTLYSTLRVAL
jgi:hypothetical protein